MRHDAPADAEAGAHPQPVQRLEVDDGGIAELAGKDIAEALAQAPHRLLAAIARQRPAPAIAHRAQVIDAMAMVGVVMRPEHRVEPVDVVVEQLLAQFGRHRAFALVEHAHIAADGKDREHKFGVLPRLLLLGLPAVEHLAKAYGEAQHAHTAGHGDAVMPVLMHGNQQAQRNEEGYDGQHGRFRLQRRRSTQFRNELFGSAP